MTGKISGWSVKKNCHLSQRFSFRTSGQSQNQCNILEMLYRRFPDNHFPPGETFPGQVVFPDKTFPGQDVSRTGHFPDKTFPRQMFPGQIILRNFHVHNVCKYQLCMSSHMTCRYTEHLLMCACRPAVSIRGLFDKTCSPTMGKA